MKDIAQKHACFSPVSLCTYENLVDDEAARAALNVILTKAPNADEAASLERRFNAIERERYFVTNEYGEPNVFRFSIESECNLSPEYIAMKAMSVLKASVIDLSMFIESCSIDQRGNMYALRLDGYDHTIGNFVQTLIYNMHIRGSSDADLEYIGYYVPHPLENTMVMKLMMKESVDVRKFMAKALADIVTYLDHVADDLKRGLTEKAPGGTPGGTPPIAKATDVPPPPSPPASTR